MNLYDIVCPYILVGQFIDCKPLSASEPVNIPGGKPLPEMEWSYEIRDFWEPIQMDPLRPRAKPPIAGITTTASEGRYRGLGFCGE